MMQVERFLSILSAPSELERRWRSLAALEVVLNANWETRVFSFNAAWDAQLAERMGSFRSGSGDEGFCLFGRANRAVLKVYERHLPVFDVGTRTRFPAFVKTFIKEPAFSCAQCSFLLWNADANWQHVPLECEGRTFRFAQLLVEDAPKVCDWLRSYYETEVRLATVEAFWQHEPIKGSSLRRLRDGGRDVAAMRAELDEIAYPYERL